MKEAVLYAREGASAGAPHVGVDYLDKFANLLRLARAQRTEVVVVDTPGVLGDTYDEIVQSLSLLAERGLQLAISTPQPGAVTLNTLQRQRRKWRGRR